jgi:hypothetical protein
MEYVHVLLKNRKTEKCGGLLKSHVEVYYSLRFSFKRYIAVCVNV